MRFGLLLAALLTTVYLFFGFSAIVGAFALIIVSINSFAAGTFGMHLFGVFFDSLDHSLWHFMYFYRGNILWSETCSLGQAAGVNECTILIILFAILVFTAGVDLDFNYNRQQTIQVQNTMELRECVH
uniref:NADH dehydrogenase subunit 6 n=1 Tax=Ditylenchus dipsaci TaxID=166011 RepID=A0A915CWQ6_9BILA